MRVRNAEIRHTNDDLVIIVDCRILLQWDHVDG